MDLHTPRAMALYCIVRVFINFGLGNEKTKRTVRKMERNPECRGKEGENHRGRIVDTRPRWSDLCALNSPLYLA